MREVSISELECMEEGGFLLIDTEAPKMCSMA